MIFNNSKPLNSSLWQNAWGRLGGTTKNDSTVADGDSRSVAPLKIFMVGEAEQSDYVVANLKGKLNEASYETLLSFARAQKAAGVTVLYLNLNSVTELGLTGRFALGNVARLFANLPLLVPERGWRAIREMAENWDVLDAPSLKLIVTNEYTLQLLREQEHGMPLPILTSSPTQTK